MSSKPSIPAITIDNSATHDQTPFKASPSSPPQNPTHARSPSDPNYLIPGGAQPRQSQDEPPSPTGSASSVKFATSVALRENQPDASSGAGSLSLLQPRGYSSSTNAHHDRKHSAASSVSAEGTEPDHLINGNNQGVSSSTTSYTAVTPNDQTQFKDSDLKKGKKNKKHDEKDKDSDQGDDAKPTEIADVTDCAPFGFRPKQLAELAENKSIKELADLGGIEKLVESLGTDREKGLSPHAVGLGGEDGGKSGGSGAFSATKQDRQRVFGINQMPPPKSKSLLQLMWIALQDKVLVLLSIAAVVSLALGLYQDIGAHEFIACPSNPQKDCNPRVDFVEGVAIMVAIFIVVMVGSLNDWQKERQFRALNDKKEDRTVKVIRDGKEAQINIKEIMVGDIAIMEPGEIIPVDGIFVSGHNVKCDESGATGESDAIKKFPFEDVYKEWQEKDGKTKKDCFILSGSKVLEGVGSYVVVAIGERSFNGRILLALRKPVAATPLQEKLNNLAELIAKVGGLCGLILFTSLMIKFFVQLKSKPNRTSNQKAMSFVQILIISVTLVVVAVPEGLPLAVTLALAFATKRMTGEKLLVRVLDSCETMANANVVCTDKTGTLTQNVMHVVAGSVGVHAKFVKNLKENLNRSDANDESGGSRKHDEDFAIEQDDLSQVLPANLQACLNEAIAVNSTAFEDVDKETGEIDFVGSKTETALLRFAKDQNWLPYRETRNNAKVEQVLPFDSALKYMGVIVKHGDKYRAYFKGASEILTRECTRHVVVGTPEHPVQASKDDPIETKEIDSKTEENIANTIIFYANQMLRTIAICYRDVDQWPPPGKAKDEVPLTELAHELTLIAITGIEDPLRPTVRDAIKDAAHAGVDVKMCTGDNVLTARSIAAQCGIYREGGVIMEGPVFRRLSDKEREDVVPHLQVLARSSPEDKKILVETLMRQGNVVGVTGDGTNDGPALKEANVGFSMGIAGTEVAKEASDIILMDDNFASIVSAIIWGRCVNDSVRKFLQFQISVNITAVLITFISAVASDEEESVLTAVQLLWINIIMDTFAALALATDPATRKLLDRKPDARNAPLFTVEMGKMIIGQAIYQTFIVLLLHFAGPSFFNVPHDNKELSAMVFNVFVFCQIFNSINCRTIDGTKNVFAGIQKNYYFMVITLLEVVIQVVIMYVGGVAFSVTRISGKYWAMSIGLGLVSLPLGFLIRFVPNGPLHSMLVHIRIIQDPAALPTKNPNVEQYNDAIDTVRENLGIFSNIRGGRVRGSSMVLKARRRARKHDSGVTLPSLMTMVPGLVASSVAARWAPAATGLHDPANGDPSKSSAALWEGKLQLHPDTKPDSEAYRRWGAQIEKTPSNASRSNANVNEKR